MKKEIKMVMANKAGLDVNDPDFESKYESWLKVQEEEYDVESEKYCHCCGQRLEA